MKKIVLVVLALSMPAYLLFSCKKESKNTQKTFVLVHGAFQAAYVWQYVQADLERAGHRVIAVELPGHGIDRTSPADLTLDAYRDKVIATIDSTPGKVILVGHSMGGMVISATAEKIPQRIEKMVYIAGFLPANGQALTDLALTDSQSSLGPNLIPTKDMLTLDLPKDSVVPIFCADGNDFIKSLLITHYQSEPAIPFTNKVILTSAGFGSVDKYYVHTVRDRAIGLDLQNRMVAAAGVTNLYTIDASHSPFLSKPDSVAAILLEIAR